jgi:two-component system KDP operon response regulator KdpE
LAVLIVEDDSAVAEVVAAALDSRGYRTTVAMTGRAALDAVDVHEPDIVILDLGLPDIDGIEVCRALRRSSRRPIIVLSADGAEERKIAALDEGADDYVTKPFSMGELMARVRVVERHRLVAALAVDDAVLTFGDLVVDTAAHAARAGEVELDLTRKEFALLSLLVRNAGRVITHGVLIEHVWGRKSTVTDSLRVHVAQLRRKLGEAPQRPIIESAPGTGYRLVLRDAL